MVADCSPSSPAQSAVLKSCGVSIDTGLFSASVGDESLDLTAREFDLLSLLLQESYRVLSRDEIRRRVWNASSSGKRVVDTYICRVRKKLRGAGHPGIGTVRRRGYRLLAAAE